LLLTFAFYLLLLPVCFLSASPVISAGEFLQAFSGVFRRFQAFSGVFRRFYFISTGVKSFLFSCFFLFFARPLSCVERDRNDTV
jgi:hypothetical protein